jgi:hypothetical protein
MLNTVMLRHLANTPNDNCQKAKAYTVTVTAFAEWDLLKGPLSIDGMRTYTLDFAFILIGRLSFGGLRLGNTQTNTDQFTLKGHFQYFIVGRFSNHDQFFSVIKAT